MTKARSGSCGAGRTVLHNRLADPLIGPASKGVPLHFGLSSIASMIAEGTCETVACGWLEGFSTARRWGAQRRATPLRHALQRRLANAKTGRNHHSAALEVFAL